MLSVHIVFYLTLRSCDMLIKVKTIVGSNMHPVSAAQLNHILSLLNSTHSGHDISSHISLHHTTISRICRKHCSDLQNVPARCPPKLSEANTHYAQHLITSKKAENAAQITQIFQQVTNQSLTSQTTRNHLKRAGMKVLDTDHRWISDKSIPLCHPPLYLPFPKSVPISVTSLTLLRSSLFPLSHPLSLCSLFHRYPFPCHYDPLVSRICFLSPCSCLPLFHAST